MKLGCRDLRVKSGLGVHSNGSSLIIPLAISRHRWSSILSSNQRYVADLSDKRINAHDEFDRFHDFQKFDQTNDN